MKKNHKYCQKTLKTNLSKKYNSLKDNEYSLNGFSITENSFRIFESTNHRRGRENSKLKIGPTLDQSFVKLGPNVEVNSAKISSIWSND